ncbi:MAG: hypothetical protein AAGE96_16140 [Cyanobacteria bacterium P01_G01_bin.19]
MSDNKTFELDGTRPIESSKMKVADTFEDDGTRPIGESPDFLITDRHNDSESDRTSRPVSSSNLDTDLAIEIDGKRPVDTKDVEVVDTFEDDGTRPIMANKYDVVGTLDIDGERPVTSK